MLTRPTCSGRLAWRPHQVAGLLRPVTTHARTRVHSRTHHARWTAGRAWRRAATHAHRRSAGRPLGRRCGLAPIGLDELDGASPKRSRAPVRPRPSGERKARASSTLGERTNGARLSVRTRRDRWLPPAEQRRHRRAAFGRGRDRSRRPRSPRASAAPPQARPPAAQTRRGGAIVALFKSSSARPCAPTVEPAAAAAAAALARQVLLRHALLDRKD